MVCPSNYAATINDIYDHYDNFKRIVPVHTAYVPIAMQLPSSHWPSTDLGVESSLGFVGYVCLNVSADFFHRKTPARIVTMGDASTPDCSRQAANVAT